MWDSLFALARPMLHALDPETAHEIVLRGLQSGLVPSVAAAADPRLAVELLGMRFPNPLGIAAGFDKDALAPDALLGFGLGFAEVGTITPQPQAGNPRPRIFRLDEDRAIVNRLGFNSQGHAAARRRLAARRGRDGIVGVNIGANKDSPDRIADYVHGVAAFHDVASYLAINVSSPNTAGLRGLQARDALEKLLARIGAARAARAAPGRPIPILLKIAPDLDEGELQDIAAVCLGGAVEGVIVSNTTVSRPPLKARRAGEAGGLSGAPLFPLATRTLARFHRATQGRLPLVGVGGVDSAEAAWQKIRAGASLVQLYTGLIFEGPGLVPRILAGLAERLSASGFARLQDAVGSGAADWVAETPPPVTPAQAAAQY